MPTPPPQPPPEPTCIRIKREAQAVLDRETAGMTPRQRDAHINRIADEFAERLGFTQISHAPRRDG